MSYSLLSIKKHESVIIRRFLRMQVQFPNHGLKIKVSAILNYSSCE